MDNYHSSTIGESDTVKFNQASKYEVIGNIYENPELLEKVEEIPVMKGAREALDKIVI